MVKKAAKAVPNHLLRAARQRRSWTQQMVADQIGAPLPLNITRWERGTAFPSAFYVQKLCQLFQMSAEELGLLRIDTASQPSQRSRTEPLRRQSGHLPLINTLPLPATPLIGREREMGDLCSRLRSPGTRLLTLVGPAGVGKTRLALQVAAELESDFVDSVCFLSLAAILDPLLLMPTIAHAFGLSEKGQQPLPDLLKAALREKEALLVLDNFEQLVATAPQVADLLLACPHLKILVTSRETLRLQGEQLFLVSPLAVPDLAHLPAVENLLSCASVSPLIECTQAVKPGFALTEANARDIAEICVRLEGLPLALELAAARLHVLSPRALLARLSAPLQILTRGPLDLPERQQTLRRAIRWSYDLLESWEQLLFRCLSVFASGCSMEAIEAVSGAVGYAGEQVLDGITSLLEKSLLTQQEQENGEPRLGMLEMLREYGWECLVACGEQKTVCRAHALYYLALARRAEAEMAGEHQVIWLRRLGLEHDNLRAALRWLLTGEGREQERHEAALQLAGALETFWWVRGFYSEGEHFLKQALAHSEAIPLAVRSKALTALARLSLAQGKMDQGEAYCQENLKLCQAEGYQPGIAFSLYWLGDVNKIRGNLDLAWKMFEESQTYFKAVENTEYHAWSLYDLATIMGMRGEIQQTERLYKASLAEHKEQGHKRGIAAASLGLAWLHIESESDPASTHALLEEAMLLFRELDDKQGMAIVLHFLGEEALQKDDLTQARERFEESLAWLRMINHERVVETLALFGITLALQVDQAAARTVLEESMERASRQGEKRVIAYVLEGWAYLAASRGEMERATRLWGAAEAWRESTGALLPKARAALYDRQVATARTVMDPGAFRALWAEGRAMTLEQAGVMATKSHSLL